MPVHQYRNCLSIRHDGKGVPYGANGEIREDGEANYGFKNLKADPRLSATIPELARDAPLLELVSALNRPQSGIFTIGCTSGDVSDAQGHRRSGYFEFAINSCELVGDASNYFPVFFHFDRFLAQTAPSLQAAFDWELMGAHFFDAGMDGFTCAVFVNTYYVDSLERAHKDWTTALNLLQSHLMNYQDEERHPIYRSETQSFVSSK
jgi:hypothetical protein